MEIGPVCRRARTGEPRMGHTENMWEVGESTDEVASTTHQVTWEAANRALHCAGCETRVESVI